MGIRRKAREAALQFLFQEDFAQKTEVVVSDLANQFERFCSLYQVHRKARPYALDLLGTVFENSEKIDNLIKQCAKNWRLERISVADRNLLRIGVCEMSLVDDVPAQVAINEAVEIAKRYGGDDSPSFVNGILDAVRLLIEK